MQRPHLVYVGGDESQAMECLYLGPDGGKAQAAFEAAAQDGSNSIVRYCHFPEHSQIRTPKRDGVPPKPPAAADSAPIPANREEYAAWLDTLGRPALAEEGKLLGVAVKPGVSNVDVRAALLAAKYPPALEPAGEQPPAASEQEAHGDHEEDHGI